jgi:geranylgeranyl pyrophosphate synthase
MPKSREMLEMLEKLIDDYLDFQKSRPDLPQGSFSDLSEDELELLVAAFQLHKLEQEVAEQTERSSPLH